MNSSSFATGSYPGTAGFYGNVLWQPGAKGKDAAGKPVDFRQPVFSEDYAVLDALDQDTRGQLLLVPTLFDAARAAGIITMTLGKNGAAYLQDRGRGGMMLDERTVFPLSLAKEMQAAGMALPPTAANTYAAGEIALPTTNGNPTEFKPPKRLGDGVSSDPTSATGSGYKGALEYMVGAYLDYVLPRKQPRLSVLWLRDPYAGLVAIAHHRAERHSEILHVSMRDNTEGRKHLRLELLGRIVHHGPHIHTVCGRIHRSADIGNGGLEDLLGIRHDPDFDRLPNFDPRHVRLVLGVVPDEDFIGVGELLE